MIAGVHCVALSATSVMRLMISPGAVSMNIEASPATGRKPRAVVPMNAASCGWSESRKTYVRSVTSAMARHPTQRPHARQRAVASAQRREPLPQRLELGAHALVFDHDALRARGVVVELRVGELLFQVALPCLALGDLDLEPGDLALAFLRGVLPGAVGSGRGRSLAGRGRRCGLAGAGRGLRRGRHRDARRFA